MTHLEASDHPDLFVPHRYLEHCVRTVMQWWESLDL